MIASAFARTLRRPLRLPLAGRLEASADGAVIVRLPNPIASTSAIPNEFNADAQGLPQGLGPGNSDIGATTHHLCMEDVDNGTFQVWYPNFGATAGHGEWHLGADATARCSILWIDEDGHLQVTRLTGRNGFWEVLAPAGGFFMFFGPQVRPKVGSHFWLSFFGIFPKGGYYSHGKADYANGDALQYGSGLADLTGTATPYQNTWTGGGDYYGPSLIGMIGARRPTAVNDSDSREAGVLVAAGYDAADDLYGAHGEFNRLFQPFMAVIDISIPGATAAEMADPLASPNRDLLARCCSLHAYGLGVNDTVFKGDTAIDVETHADIRQTRIAAPIFLYKTIAPAVLSGTDNTIYDGLRDLERRAENLRRRATFRCFDAAQGLESPTEPGTLIDLAFTLDGIHNSAAGDRAAVAGSGYDVQSVFPTAGRVDAGFRYPAGAIYQSLDLEGFSTGNAVLSADALYSPDHKYLGAIIGEDHSLSTHAILKTVTLQLAGATRTYQLFARRYRGKRNLFFQIQKNGGNYADIRAVVDLGTGQLSYTSGEAGVQTVDSVSLSMVEDWISVSLTVTYGAAMPANPFVFIKLCDETFADTYQGDGVSSISVWGVDIR